MLFLDFVTPWLKCRAIPFLVPVYIPSKSEFHTKCSIPEQDDGSVRFLNKAVDFIILLNMFAYLHT